MTISRITTSEKDKLYNALYSYTRSLVKRGVAIQCIANSGEHGTIDIEINGKRGIIRKNIIRVHGK